MRSLSGRRACRGDRYALRHPFDKLRARLRAPFDKLRARRQAHTHLILPTESTFECTPWNINGQIVYVDNASISGQVVPGALVEFEGYYDANGRFIVTKVEVKELPAGNSGEEGKTGSGNDGEKSEPDDQDKEDNGEEGEE